MRVATIASSSSVDAPRADVARATMRVRARPGEAVAIDLRADAALAVALARCDEGVVHACATDDDVALVSTRDGARRTGAVDALARVFARHGADVASAAVGRTWDGVALSGGAGARGCALVAFGDAGEAAREREVVVTLTTHARAGERTRTRSRARASGCHLVEAPACEATPRAGTATWALADGDAAASLAVNENCDPDVRADLDEALAAIVREASEDEATRAAARAMLVGGAVRAPVTNGRARMGTWQGLYLCEHGARGEHARDVLAVCDAREATARTTIVVSAGKRGLRDITDDVTAAIRDAHRPGTIGTLHCFCEHTSASLVVGPSDPTFATRFEDALNDIVPESWNDEFFRHTAEGPDDMPAHVKSTIVGAHKTVPVDADGTLSPLNGQRLYLCEHRNVGGFNSGLARRVTLTLQCD